MIRHQDLGESKEERSRNFQKLLRSGKIVYGGNKKLKIYGVLQCKSGKRLKVENRVFFESEREALSHGFRPCGNCMRRGIS